MNKHECDVLTVIQYTQYFSSGTPWKLWYQCPTISPLILISMSQLLSQQNLDLRALYWRKWVCLDTYAGFNVKQSKYFCWRERDHSIPTFPNSLLITISKATVPSITDIWYQLYQVICQNFDIKTRGRRWYFNGGPLENLQRCPLARPKDLFNENWLYIRPDLLSERSTFSF